MIEEMCKIEDMVFIPYPHYFLHNSINCLMISWKTRSY